MCVALRRSEASLTGRLIKKKPSKTCGHGPGIILADFLIAVVGALCCVLCRLVLRLLIHVVLLHK